MVVFAMSCAEIDRRGRPVAALASQSGKDFREGPVAMLHGQQAERKDRCALAAVKLKTAVRPVGEAVGEAERRRVHGRRLPIEHKANENEKRESPRARSFQVAARIFSTSSTAFAAQPAAPGGTSGRNLS
jgi:hypothetical protein